MPVYRMELHTQVRLRRDLEADNHLSVKPLHATRPKFCPSLKFLIFLKNETNCKESLSDETRKYSNVIGTL